MEKYFLHINEPCSQNWDKMTATEKGKFCSSCQKTVFDFTSATDNEIIKYIESMKGEEFCGNFEEGQLNKWIHSSQLKNSNKKLYELMLSLILLAGGQNLYAQEATKKEPIEQDCLLQKRVLKGKIANVNIDKYEKEHAIKDYKITVGKEDSTKRTIRGGVISFNNYNTPLIILDGIPITDSIFSKIDTSLIETVSVLKSAEAEVIYGSLAANGAIIITSKPTDKKKTSKKPLIRK